MYSKEIIETEIAKGNRHMFLYGKNNVEREKFLKGVSNKYPFKFNKNDSSVIYIDEIGLPNIDHQIAVILSKTKIKRIAISYLEFSIVQNIINKINQSDIKDNARLNDLINEFNSISKIKYENLDEIISSLQKSREFYYNFYEEYLKTGDDKFARENFSNLDIDFIFDLSMFVKNIKEATNNNSSFQIILDRKGKIPLVSVMAINSVINTRCNKDLSIKVACEPNEWETHTDLNNSFIEFTHDFGVLELDNSYSEHLKTEKKKYELNINDNIEINE